MLPCPVYRRPAARWPLRLAVTLIAVLSGLKDRAGEIRVSPPTVSIRTQSGLPGLIVFPLVVMPLLWECIQRD
jgi:hypothetical protein